MTTRPPSRVTRNVARTAASGRAAAPARASSPPRAHEAAPSRASRVATGTATGVATGAVPATRRRAPHAEVLAGGIALVGGRITQHGRALVVQAAVRRAGASALLTAAGEILEAGTLAGASAATRKAVVDDVSALFARQSSGRPSLRGVRARAAAFALCEECLLHMRGKSEEPRALALLEELRRVAAREPFAGLRVHMERRLQPLPARAAEGARIFVAESTTGHGTSLSMRPRKDGATAAGAERALTAAVDVTAALYARFGQGAERAADRAAVTITAHGFFSGEPGAPPVRVVVGAGDKPAVEVTVNRAYAQQDPVALQMLVAFHTTLALAQRAEPPRPLAEARLIALAVMGQGLADAVPFSDVADVLVRQFARTQGFPPTLSWPVLERALVSDRTHLASPKMVRVLERAMEHTFLEVNPARTSAADRRYLGAALDVLRKSPSAIGRLTYDLIASGRVRIDILDDLTAADYRRVRRDFMKDGTELSPDQREALARRDTKSFRAITTSIDGYMWDDRAYVAPGLPPVELAGILVHEVNHIVNASEEHYRGEQATFNEEYRAFLSTAMFKGERLTKARCREIKAGVVRDYKLKTIDVDAQPDRPPGILDVIPPDSPFAQRRAEPICAITRARRAPPA